MVLYHGIFAYAILYLLQTCSLLIICWKDDPYELYNLYDSERTIADDMLADLRTQANTITETAVVTDEITSDDPNFPVNTGFATTGWCTTNDQ